MSLIKFVDDSSFRSRDVIKIDRIADIEALESQKLGVWSDFKRVDTLVFETFQNERGNQENKDVQSARIRHGFDSPSTVCHTR